MKEKLIVFTRNEKNRRKLIMANIIILAIVIAAILFFDITKINIVVRVLIGVPIILIVCGNYVVSKLFELDENVIRNNKISIIFMAYSDVVYWIFIIILALMTKGQVGNIILFIILLVAFMFVSEWVKKYFRNKIKNE